EVDLVALRVVDDRGASDYAWIERALRWVHLHRNDFDNPITTVNLSMGSLPGSVLSSSQRILDDELAQLARDGILVVAAAGNGYDVQPTVGLSYPASVGSVLAVGSVDNAGQLSAFSRRDLSMLAAPGEAVVSSIPDRLYSYDGVMNDWRAYSGTSQAAPFVTGGAVLLREALWRTGLEQIDGSLLSRILRQTADSIYDSVTQQTYTRVNLFAAVRSVLGDPTPRSAASGLPRLTLPVSAADLGRLTYKTLEPMGAYQGPVYYRFTATQSGWLSIDNPALGRSSESVQLFDSHGQFLLPATQLPGDAQRRDWQVTAGQSYLLQIDDEFSDSTYTLANVLSEQSGQWGITIPAQIEQLDLSFGETVEITLGRLTYAMDASELRDVVIHATPQQTARFTGSVAADRFIVKPGRLTWQQGTHQLDVMTPRNISVAGSAHQGDEVRLYGTSGDEHYTAGNGVGRLVGSDFGYRVSGFDRVYVFAGGGEDVAELSGTAGDDVFVSRDTGARLSSDTHLEWLEDVERIYADSGSGGVDRAFLYGSATDDVLVAHPDVTRLSDSTKLRQVSLFDRVYATADAGGVDRAFLYGSRGTDEFHAELAESRMSGPAYLTVATAFDRVYADGGGGSLDTASLQGSDLDDRFSVNEVAAALSSPAYHWEVADFDQVLADGGNAGRDDVVFQGTAGDSQLRVSPEGTLLQTSYGTWQATQFSSVFAQGGAGRDYALVGRLVSLSLSERAGRRRLLDEVRTDGYLWLATADELSGGAGIRIASTNG
ncbi:MAG: S8 family serine peptidase, partial [Planctomycetales bacterium]|nr:S8 family serine peptidase [Planctomycetales bacterium]